jgi:hypothetical protein
MPRKSTVDRLGPEVRDAIGRLLDEGATLDEILAHLENMSVEVSRSALGRYTQKLAAAGEKLRRSRAVAEALVRRFGDQPESKTARLNIELLHGAILDLFMVEDDAAADAEDGKKKKAGLGDPMGAMLLAKALESLTKASRQDVEFVEKAKKLAAEAAKKQAATAAEQMAREKGLSAATIDAIKASILGVKAALASRARSPRRTGRATGRMPWRACPSCPMGPTACCCPTSGSCWRRSARMP